MWTEFKREAPFVAKPPLVRQHFLRVLRGCTKGLVNTQTFGKLFFNFLRSNVFLGNPEPRREIRADETSQRAIRALRTVNNLGTYFVSKITGLKLQAQTS
jgi:hypothetical protein